MTSIKTKLSWGFSFLFCVILLLASLGIYYIQSLANDAKVVLKANYESLVYTRAMLEVLNNGRPLLDTTGLDSFEANLKGQEKNITEVNEGEQTILVRQNFEAFKKQLAQMQANPHDSSLAYNYKVAMRIPIYKINELNLQAIKRKSAVADDTADKGVIVLSILGTICVLITFSFIINFPGYIANPLQQLTEGIREVTNRNYEARLQFDSDDELGELAHSFNRMAVKLDEYEHSNLAQLISEKRRIETLLNQMQDAVIGLSEKRNVLFVNEVALHLLGLTAEGIVGEYAPDIALKNDLLRHLLNSTAEEKEIKIYADGRESFFSKETVEVQNDGQIIGLLIVLKNITKFHDLDEAKTNFIATISHELKTPISAIKMSLKLLEDERIGRLNHEQKLLIENVKDDAQRLLKITGELLDLTQVETGNIQLQMQPVSAKSMVDLAVEALQFQADQKQIALEINIPATLPLVQADLEKTAWVVVNFLSNAIRYSPEQSKIEISAEQKGRNVLFSVRDFGKGIEQKYLSRIFDRYFQVPNNGQSMGGNGLGLSISKSFIEAQYGRIWAESEGIGEGSRFSFELPATR